VFVPLALAIAASRVVLGLHYPTDVLVGAALGAMFAAIGVALV
jgi:undecaprenyl-diphosphatase